MLPKSLLDISEKAPISHVTEIPTTNKIVHIKIGKNLSITQDGILNAADTVVPSAAEADIVQSLEGDRAEVIPANTNYTVPEYIVGINSLQVYVNGARASCGSDPTKHLYKEIGIENQPSTSIQFLDPIPVDAEIIIEVNRTLTQAVIDKLGDNILPSIENKTNHYLHTDGTVATWETLSDKFLPTSGGTITGSIIPSTDETIDLGSATHRFKTLYAKEARLDVNTLWLGDTPVLGTSADTIVIKADRDQSLQVKTSGIGSTQIISESTVQISSTGSAADIKMIASGQGAKASITANTQADINAPNINFTGSIAATGGVQVDSLTVTGNLTVKGTTTVVDSNTLQVKDNIVEINKGESGAGVTAGKSGIQIDRGTSADYLLVFDETDDMFKVGTSDSLETLATREFIDTLTATDINAAPASHVTVAASTTALGHIKIGNGFTNNNGTISVTYGTAANTSCVGNDARLSNSRTPVAHASTTTTYGVSSATNYGHAMASSAVPLIAGTATAGLDNGKFAREGHVHPAQINISGNAETSTKTFSVPLVIPTETTATATLTANTDGITSYFSSMIVALQIPFNSVASTTLNINNLGAKPVYYNDQGVTAGYIRANAVHLLVYETSTLSTGCWKLVYSYDANNVVTQTVTTTNAEYGLLFTSTASPTATRTEGTRFDTNVTINPSTNTITATTFKGALSGNASSATKLATARTINGVFFNGTANITIPASRTRQQSLSGERTATINANTNYTVPAYTVGQDQLDVYLSGLYCACGTDASKHTYKEVGTAGTSSTVIQFLDNIDTTHDIVVISHRQ